MRGKGLLWTPLLAMLLLSMATTNTYSSDVTVISVQPPAIANPDLGPGDTFSVNVTVSDVENLAGYEFKLNYTTSVLTTSVDDVTVVTDWFGPSVEIWKKTVDDAAGYVWLIVTLPLGTVMGVYGSGVVVTITFTVDDYGTTVLDLNDTELGDPLGTPISHDSDDGFFANVPLPKLWIKDKGAQGGGIWPEWHVAPAGTEQTLYARIVNTGDVGCYVKVEMAVYNPLAGSFPVWSNSEWIPPKAAHNVTVIVSATFEDTYTVGVYYVSGTLWFSLDNTLWVPYSALEGEIGGRGTTRDVPGNDATKFKTY